MPQRQPLGMARILSQRTHFRTLKTASPGPYSPSRATPHLVPFQLKSYLKKSVPNYVPKSVPNYVTKSATKSVPFFGAFLGALLWAICVATGCRGVAIHTNSKCRGVAIDIACGSSMPGVLFSKLLLLFAIPHGGCMVSSATSMTFFFCGISLFSAACSVSLPSPPACEVNKVKRLCQVRGVSARPLSPQKQLDRSHFWLQLLCTRAPPLIF